VNVIFLNVENSNSDYGMLDYCIKNLMVLLGGGFHWPSENAYTRCDILTFEGEIVESLFHTHNK
jgi:hypothetical protein